MRQALGFVLWCPDALLDDGADGPDREIQQPSRVPMGDGEWARIWHLWAADQKGGWPVFGREKPEGAQVNVQEASEVRGCAFWSEHLGDITVDI